MKSKVFTRGYIVTLLLVLYFTHFCGFVPLAGMLRGSGLTFELPILAVFFCCGLMSKDKKSDYFKWFIYLVITVLLNYVSTMCFENRSFIAAVQSCSFVHYLLLFFPLCVLQPTVKDIERVVITLGIYQLVLYFVQQALLPTPIVESIASGWRTTNDSSTENFDFLRYSITGELLMYWFQLLCMNRFISSKKIIYLIGVLAVAVMCVLHGYRSTMFAMIIGLGFLFIKVNGVKINVRSVSIVVACLLFLYFMDDIPVFHDVLERISEKNENQFSNGGGFADLDRVIEFDFFYNHQIQNFWEWFFGCGFLSKEEYAPLPGIMYWINWVDLGFIGLSFMGGILMTICWIRLLLLNMRSVPVLYMYISAYSVFVIASTIVLPQAFIDCATTIQGLALYFGYRLSIEKRIQI